MKDLRIFICQLLVVLGFLHTAMAAGYDVIVLGSGISGLSAATSLQNAGFKVVVLEARDRIGGRIWSRTVNNNKSTVDFGASWIHGISNNPIYKIVKEKNISTLPTNYDSITVYNKGAELTAAASDAVDNMYEVWYDYQKAQAKAAATDRGLGTTVDSYIEKEALSAADQDKLWYGVHSTIEHEYAGSVYNMSLKYWDADEEPVGGDVLFPGGYKQIVDAVASNLTILTGKVVTSVAYGSGSATVTTKDGSKYTANAVVVTLPVGVLKAGDVEFKPPLPSDKTASIQKLQMGLLQKVVLVFPSKFWDDTEWLGRIAANPKRNRWAQFVNLHYYYKQPMLMCFNAADYAWQIENDTDAEFAAGAMAALKEMYGANIPDPTEVYVSRWGSDPYSKGAYTFLGVGATPKDRTTLGAPVGKELFFAGEAVNTDWPSTVHGAFISGQEAAKEIQDAGVKRSGTPSKNEGRFGRRVGKAMAWLAGVLAASLVV